VKTRVLLADDHVLVRAGIRALLDTMDDIEVIGEASDGREALGLVGQHKPDVILMDISMSGLNGLDATAIVARDHPDTRVIILSMHAGESSVQQALGAGAAGYLLKEAAVAELPMAIRAVMEGNRFISPAVSAIVVDGFLSGRDREAGPLRTLTLRQREILQLLAEGRSAKEVAFALGLSVKTVETHRRQIMDRLQIFDLAGLVRFAIRSGLVSPDS
jgi:DNA-binding NarL/FixJ family response regulator